VDGFFRLSILCESPLLLLFSPKLNPVLAEDEEDEAPNTVLGLLSPPLPAIKLEAADGVAGVAELEPELLLLLLLLSPPNVKLAPPVLLDPVLLSPPKEKPVAAGVVAAAAEALLLLLLPPNEKPVPLPLLSLLPPDFVDAPNTVAGFVSAGGAGAGTVVSLAPPPPLLLPLSPPKLKPVVLSEADEEVLSEPPPKEKPVLPVLAAGVLGVADCF